MANNSSRGVANESEGNSVKNAIAAPVNNCGAISGFSPSDNAILLVNDVYKIPRNPILLKKCCNTTRKTIVESTAPIIPLAIHDPPLSEIDIPRKIFHRQKRA